MYIEKSQIELVQQQTEVKVSGMNLQSSGLPITFDSLGMMWDRYTPDKKEKTRYRTDSLTEYGVCLNKVPDYIVGVEVSSYPEDDQEYYGYVIPNGEYIKATFNARDHEELVSERLMSMQKKAKKWAKDNKIKCSNLFTVEVYPIESRAEENLEMYILIPVLK